MNVSVTLSDARVTARIVNLAYRLGCSVRRITLDGGPTGCDADFAFTGPPDALRRLDAQIARVVADETAPLDAG